MKKFFLTLSIAAMGLVKGFAQELDLQAFITFDTASIGNGSFLTDTADRTNTNAFDWYLGQTVTTTFAYVQPTADSVWGALGIQYNGPDAIDAGSNIMYQNSYGRYLTLAECAANNVVCNDTSRYWYTWQRPVSTDIVDPGIVSLFGFQERMKNDSVKLLFDWKMWVDSGINDIQGPPYETFVAGKEYGLFVWVRGLNNFSTPANIDPFPRNNVYVHKIIWKGYGVSVKDMIAKRSLEALVVYPNPAANNLKFDYEFKQNTNASLIIRDVTGRIVKTENFGRQVIGKQTFAVDIAALANGNYVAEFQTGEVTAVSKFSVAK
ncbi:MAG: hypothetical protein BGO31_18010 [Bacteroidetes bacterium 43-16]|nr:MAG: hypothetical protein BGO31_18010 [Bacteroidetes bacterium 43-16]